MPEEEKQPEPLFDVLIPPGVPQTIIVEISKKFEVEIVDRKQKLNFANMEGDERELLAFRGKREIAEQVEEFMIKRLKEYIGD